MKAWIRFDVDGTDDMVLKAADISVQLRWDKRTKWPQGVFKLRDKRGRKFRTVQIPRVILVDINHGRKS